MLIVLDDYHVRFDAGFLVRTKAIARKLVERLGPSDQAAVIATSGRSVMQAEFTGDKSRLIDTIDKFFPQSEQPESSESSVQANLRNALGTPAGGGFGFINEIKARWYRAIAHVAIPIRSISSRSLPVVFQLRIVIFW